MTLERKGPYVQSKGFSYVFVIAVWQRGFPARLPFLPARRNRLVILVCIRLWNSTRKRSSSCGRMWITRRILMRASGSDSILDGRAEFPGAMERGFNKTVGRFDNRTCFAGAALGRNTHEAARLLRCGTWRELLRT